MVGFIYLHDRYGHSRRLTTNFKKMEIEQYRCLSVIRFLFYGREMFTAKSKSAWILYTVMFSLRRPPSKIALTCSKVVARRFLVSRAPKMATKEDNVTKIPDHVLADRQLKVRETAETVSKSLHGSCPAYTFPPRQGTG